MDPRLDGSVSRGLEGKGIRLTRSKLCIPILLISTFGGVACGSDNAGNDEVLVFAATSLTDALDQSVAKFEAENSGNILVSYGGSQALAQQIAAGAPADIFISAGQFPVDFLDGRQVKPLDI